MTCTAALIVTATAGVIFAAVGTYAAILQARWVADQQRKDQEDHHG